MIELPSIISFSAETIQPVLVDARTEGPGGFGFPPVTGTTDGGGWWEWSWGGLHTISPEHIKTLRAFAMMVRAGRRIRVPIIDDPQLLGPANVPSTFSDAATFSDTSVFVGGSVDAVLEEPAGLRDDEVVIWMRSGHVLTGGEFWSLERGFEKGPELHLNGSVESLGDNRWRCRLGPNLRQDHAAGAEVNFNTPAFAATIPDTSTLWPSYGLDWIGEASVTFVEAP